MGSLRQKIASFLAPLAASAALMTGGQARAENNPAVEFKEASMTQTAKRNLIDMRDFSGKSFEERMLKAEEIVQRYNLENKTQFSDIFEVLMHNSRKHSEQISPKMQKFLKGTDYQILHDADAINESIEIIRLGRLRREIDTSLTCAEQLRSCGFDLLAKVAENKVTMAELSDEKRAEIFEQYDVGANFFNMPGLFNNIVEQDKGKANPIAWDSQTVHGHQLKGENLYAVKIAKRVHQKINKEKLPVFSRTKSKE